MITVRVVKFGTEKTTITDGKNTIEVKNRELADKIKQNIIKIEAKDIYEVKCVDKIRNKNSIITDYILVDKQGKRAKFKADLLKDIILFKQMKVVNLTLTSDNRLIDAAEKEQQTKKIVNKQNKKIVQLVDKKESIPNRKYTILEASNDRYRFINILHSKLRHTDKPNIDKILSDNTLCIDTDRELEMYINVDDTMNNEELRYYLGPNIKSVNIWLGQNVNNSTKCRVKHIETSGSLAIYNCIDNINGDVIAKSIDLHRLTLNDCEIHCNTLELIDVTVKDGAVAKCYIKNNVKISTFDRQALNKMLDLNKCGQLLFYTSSKSKAFGKLINFGFDVIPTDEEGKEIIENINKRKGKEILVGTNIVKKVVKTMINEIDAAKRSNICHNSIENHGNIEEDVIKAYRLDRVDTEYRDMLESEYNLIKNLQAVYEYNNIILNKKVIDSLVVSTKYDCKAYEVDITQNIPYVAVCRYYLFIIKSSELKTVDKYMLILNGNKIMHMFYFDTLYLRLNSIKSDNYAESFEALKIIDAFSGTDQLSQTMSQTVDVTDSIRLITLASDILNQNAIYDGTTSEWIVPFETVENSIVYKTTYKSTSKSQVRKPLTDEFGKIDLQEYKAVSLSGIVKADTSISQTINKTREKLTKQFKDSVTMSILKDINSGNVVNDISTILIQKCEESIYHKLALKHERELLTCGIVKEQCRNKDNTLNISTETLLDILSTPLCKEIDKLPSYVSQNPESFKLLDGNILTTYLASSKNKRHLGNCMNIVLQVIVIQNKQGYGRVFACEWKLFKTISFLQDILTGDADSSLDVILKMDWINDKIKTYFTTLYSTGKWTGAKKKSIKHKGKIVIDNKTGYIYYVKEKFRERKIEDGRYVRYEKYDCIYKMIFRIPTTEIALQLAAKLDTEEHSRRDQLAMIKDLINEDSGLVNVIPRLQSNNEKKLIEYKKALNSDRRIYDTYKNYIGYIE